LFSKNPSLTTAQIGVAPAGDELLGLRKFIKEQPYTATLIALGIGWLLGRTHRPL